MRISDWSSDVCSSDLAAGDPNGDAQAFMERQPVLQALTDDQLAGRFTQPDGPAAHLPQRHARVRDVQFCAVGLQVGSMQAEHRSVRTVYGGYKPGAWPPTRVPQHRCPQTVPGARMAQ